MKTSDPFLVVGTAASADGIDAPDCSNRDMLNLFASANLATVLLDRQLKVRSFTPAMSTIFDIRSGDRGRPLTDLSSQLITPTLSDDIASVFENQALIERRATNEKNSIHYLVRIAPYQTGDTQIDAVMVTFLDETLLTRAETRQQMLISELQHRTRNLLTIVETIARKTLGGAANLDEFGVRLAALSRVQSLVTGQLDEAIDLGDIVRLEMEAHGVPANRISLQGDRVTLGYDVAQTLCLALHELATNATHHGAFKTTTGHLDVSWSVAGDNDHETLVVLWKERGMPPSTGIAGWGFGRELIEKALVFTLSARCSWVREHDGVRCQIDVPMGQRIRRHTSR